MIRTKDIVKAEILSQRMTLQYLHGRQLANDRMFNHKMIDTDIQIVANNIQRLEAELASLELIYSGMPLYKYYHPTSDFNNQPITNEDDNLKKIVELERVLKSQIESDFYIDEESNIAIKTILKQLQKRKLELINTNKERLKSIEQELEQIFYKLQHEETDVVNELILGNRISTLLAERRTLKNV